MSVLEQLEARRQVDRPSSLRLHRLAFESRPDDDPQTEVWAAHRTTVEELRLERDWFLRQHPVEAFIARLVDDRLSRRGSQRRWVLGAAFAFAAAAVAIGIGTDEPELRLKGGGFQARVFVGRDQGPGRLYREGEALQAGQLLQIAVRADTAGFLAVLNLDDRGRVTRYVPGDGDVPLSLAASAGLSPLPQAIRLDGFVGRELMVLVFSPDPFTVPEVHRRLLDAFAAANGDLETVAASIAFHDSREVHVVPIRKVGL